jgi:hypothetical protein
MKYIISLISIILLITTILSKDLYTFKSKKSLQNIRNLNEEEVDTDNSQSYEETDEIESIESSESNGIEDTTISWTDIGDGNSTAPLDPEENDKAFVVAYAIDNYRYRFNTIIFLSNLDNSNNNSIILNS